MPGCGFFHKKSSTDDLPVEYGYQKRYIRFAFCKSNATLTAAAHKLGKLSGASGCLMLN